MVATLNQPQYQPWRVEEQVVAIYAGINGFLDDVPVGQVPRFQEELRETLRAEAAIYDAIARVGGPRRRDGGDARAGAGEVRRGLQRRGGDRRLLASGLAGSMASVQDYKRRIRSVTNTRKITRAMELVAAAKLRRAQTRIEAMRPYADTMSELIAGVGRAASSVRGLPLLQQRETIETVLLVPLTGDRGLAGAFNAPGDAARLRARARARRPRARRCVGSPSARGDAPR